MRQGMVEAILHLLAEAAMLAREVRNSADAKESRQLLHPHHRPKIVQDILLVPLPRTEIRHADEADKQGRQQGSSGKGSGVPDVAPNCTKEELANLLPCRRPWSHLRWTARQDSGQAWLCLLAYGIPGIADPLDLPLFGKVCVGDADHELCRVDSGGAGIPDVLEMLESCICFSEVAHPALGQDEKLVELVKNVGGWLMNGTKSRQVVGDRNASEKLNNCLGGLGVKTGGRLIQHQD
mmetsp:Transcript_131886/g.312618  ORF Transcript_131886/g.312618 Transcript_131886/m.312618 type:complete len:237 (+) Transcript_131886:145-855(+)